MRKSELIYSYMLEMSLEKKKRVLTQAEMAKALGISLSTVNNALKPLRRMGAVSVKARSLSVTDPKKALYFWAATRNVEKDIIYSTRADGSVSEIEKRMPHDTIYAAYSAYKFRFRDVPADYSEVYVYSDSVAEIKKRFGENASRPNLFVLRKDISKMTLANIFVDIWNLKEWYAKEFLKSVEERINGILA
ncbi:winged helix-turn-helix domain-containing protein [archaeon]|nr:winged helix-turn-helix domain-containing protein [archaeon]